jgi:hypothetical protein
MRWCRVPSGLGRRKRLRRRRKGEQPSAGEAVRSWSGTRRRRGSPEIVCGAYQAPNKFVANVFEDVDGAFNADRAAQDGIFIFDAEDAFVADVHVGLHDGFPLAGTVAIANGAESFRGQSQIALGFKGEVEHAVFD